MTRHSSSKLFKAKVTKFNIALSSYGFSPVIYTLQGAAKSIHLGIIQ